jgi:hypothetical protein
MPDDADQSFLGRPLPPGFEVRVVALGPGACRPYDDADWCDAIVHVRCGEVELETEAGTRRRFGRGALIWLTGLRLRTIGNPRPEPLELVAVTRRCPGDDDLPLRSPPAARSR